MINELSSYASAPLVSQSVSFMFFLHSPDLEDAENNEKKRTFSGNEHVQQLPQGPGEGQDRVDEAERGLCRVGIEFKEMESSFRILSQWSDY